MQTRPLPERFEEASKFRHNAHKQHPLYATSNNAYGAKKPSQSELPVQWNGVRVRRGCYAHPLWLVAVQKEQLAKFPCLRSEEALCQSASLPCLPDTPLPIIYSLF